MNDLIAEIAIFVFSYEMITLLCFSADDEVLSILSPTVTKDSQEHDFKIQNQHDKQDGDASQSGKAVLSQIKEHGRKLHVTGANVTARRQV